VAEEELGLAKVEVEAAEEEVELEPEELEQSVESNMEQQIVIKINSQIELNSIVSRGAEYRSTSCQEFRSSRGQNYRNTAGKENRSTGCKEFRSTGCQEYRSTGCQEYRSTGCQEYRGAVMREPAGRQEYRSTGLGLRAPLSQEEPFDDDSPPPVLDTPAMLRVSDCPMSSSDSGSTHSSHYYSAESTGAPSHLHRSPHPPSRRVPSLSSRRSVLVRQGNMESDDSHHPDLTRKRHSLVSECSTLKVRRHRKTASQ